MQSAQDPDVLKKEILGLFNYIQRVKEEVAAINRPSEEEYHFDSMSDQLAAIVKATEKATNTIMESMETNAELIGKLRPHIKGNAAANKLLDKIDTNGQNVFEACSFQDITGQRVNKITKSLGYVEQRVGAIVNILGDDALDDIAVKASEKTEDQKLLNGPQLEGKGLSQADIDALFD